LGRRIRNIDSVSFLRWFIENTLDNYLAQNTETVLKSLKKDQPPSELKEFLKEYEVSHKNRKIIVEALI
jgi:hypothetical protein